MDALTARAALGFMLAASIEPVITAGMLDVLLDDSKRMDKYGRYPTDAAWIPTYELHSAAAEGWRWKAAAVAANVSVTVDGVTVSNAQQYTHAMRMVEMHRKRIRPESVRVGGPTSNLFDRAQAIYDLSVLGN